MKIWAGNCTKTLKVNLEGTLPGSGKWGAREPQTTPQGRPTYRPPAIPNTPATKQKAIREHQEGEMAGKGNTQGSNAFNNKDGQSALHRGVTGGL